MSGLLGGGKTISTETPRVSAIRINSSAYGLAIPWLRGTGRLSANLIWYGDFKAIAHTTKQKAGGKGGGTTYKSTTYTYTCGAAFGLCAGVIAGISKVWAGKDKTTLSKLGLTLFTGAMPQTAWSYLTSQHPSQALGYSGLAYVAHAAYDLGDSASLPNLSFEVVGPRTIGEIVVGTTIHDARADEVSSDLLAEAGFPAEHVGDLANYRAYCQANGYFVTPAITEQAPCADHLASLMRMTNADVVWSEGLLKIVPYGDTEITGYGVTWTPDITPAYDLTDDDFLAEDDAVPVRVSRKTPADAFNHTQVEFTNRDLEYNPDVGHARDAAHIAEYGLRTREPISMRWITRREMADAIADVENKRGLYIRAEYAFRLGWRYARLEPMDILTLTHSALGLSRTVVRIVSIDENDDGDLDIVAEAMPWAVATPALAPTQSGSGATVDFNVAPGNANLPVIFEPPIALAGEPQLWLATSGGENWGGAEVWVSLDDATYSRIGLITAPARHGVLTANLPAGGDPDVSSVLAVDVTVSAGVLLPGTLQDRDLLTTLCWVDGELVSYQNATLTGLHQYSLSSLRRGAWGTPVGVHAINSKFVRIDEAVFRYSYDKAMVGETIYVKLRSFNSYGGGGQDLADLTPATYVIAGAPVGSVGGLFPEQPFTGRSAKIAWTDMPGALGYRVEVWAASALRRTTDTADTRFEYSFEDAKADGGPWRTLQFRVYAVTDTGVSEAPALLELTNPQIGAPTAVSALPLLEGLTISCATPGDSDYAGCRVWASQTLGFDPAVTAPVYDGPSTGFSYYGLTAGDDWYLRIGCYDVFGTDGMTLSSELHVVVRGITADPAATLAEINGLLTDGSGTAKIELLADRFAIKAPDSDKYPFAVVDTGGGVYKTLLNSDVLIGGNVDIANLTTGSLPNDVIMRLGGGTVELDGAGEIRVYEGLGANQDFVRLTAAELQFLMYISGTGYVTYNYLSRIESGQAANNDTVAIPGYWKSQPKVMVSPASLGLYKASYAAQDQSISCQALNLVETSAGSGQWQFQAVATLNLAANTGSVILNTSSGEISANNWTSSTYTTPANCTTLTPSVTLKSVRGNGAGQYYYRSIRWRVEYWSGSAWVPGSYRIVNMGAQISVGVSDSFVFSFPSAAAWQWRIYAEAYDTDGTVFGSPSYTYSTESLSSATGSYILTPGSSHVWTLASSTLNPSWEIYEIVYGATFTLNGNQNDNFSLSLAGTAVWVASNITWSSGTPNWSGTYSRTISGGALSYNTSAISMFASGMNLQNGTANVTSGSAVVKRRAPVPNSTTPVNTYTLNNYGYSLSAAQVLATGTLNWSAVGR